MSNAPITFLNRGEKILMAFFKAFFKQEYLFGHIKNEFLYTDNFEDGSLIIKMSETQEVETTNAVPALHYQEGGFSEENRIIDNRKLHEIGQQEFHKSGFFLPVTIHCLARRKASAKLLQAVTSNAIIMFRKAIYEMGVDYISPIQGQPPRRLSDAQDGSGPYDCAISFQLRNELDWFLGYSGDIEEKVSIQILAALDEIEYDNNGNPVGPVGEWFEQMVEIDNG